MLKLKVLLSFVWVLCLLQERKIYFWFEKYQGNLESRRAKKS